MVTTDLCHISRTLSPLHTGRARSSEEALNVLLCLGRGELPSSTRGQGKGEGPLGKGSYIMNKTRGMQFWKAAMRYYPDFSRATAVRRFRDEIHNTPELLEELTRLGYDERRRYFPPGQMAVIIKYLGD